MNEKKPYLKLAPNLPMTVVFETTPDRAKEYPNRFDEAKMQYLYFVSLLGENGMTEIPHAWYATERQHKEMMSKGIQEGNKYTMLLRQLPGDKFPQFMISETFNPKKVEEPKRESELDDYLETDDEIFERHMNTPMAKTSVVTRKDPQSIAWAIKCAIQYCGPGTENSVVELVAIKNRAREFLQIHQELMSE